jgi:uncharacterized protein YbjT (DUF2867 family)
MDGELPLILVTGATGYVGGRLVNRLLEKGYRVRVLVRDTARLQGRSWSDRVEIIRGDIFDTVTLERVLQGVEAAYYLVHSMTGGQDFAARDIQAASGFGMVARQKDVKQIIYLGGLGDPQSDLSKHLRSRQETGKALRKAGVPVTEFRAAIIVGSGSISFEMIRNLTERIPVMICPRWVFTRVQPIAIRDVLAYLVSALQNRSSVGEVIEIGGEDILTYGDMMLGYAQARGLRRYMLPVPVLTPRLSSYWVHWMTPVPAGIARPLIEGLRNEVIVRDRKAREYFKEIKPMDYQSAVRDALKDLEAGSIESSWSDALVSSQGDFIPVMLTSQDGMIIERRQRATNAQPAKVFQIISQLGGDYGWLYGDWLWQLRGLVDRLFGGVGLRRGRRDALALRVGDAVDFWRVEAVEPESMIRLRAEMKLSGKAWLQFEIKPQDGGCLISQTAFFASKGLLGLLYWYGLYPIHRLVFSGLINRIAERAENSAI